MGLAQANVIPYNTGFFPYTAGVLPYNAGVLPYSGGVLPYSAGVFPYNYGTLPTMYSFAPVQYKAVQTSVLAPGYVAKTPGAEHIAPLPAGLGYASHHINLAKAPGTK